MPSKTMRVALICCRLGLQNIEHADQVELAGLHDFRRQARIEEEQLLLDERRQVPAERGGVGDDLPRAFLEGDENRRLLRSVRAVDQRLQREDGLAAARPAHDAASCVREAGRRR